MRLFAKLLLVSSFLAICNSCERESINDFNFEIKKDSYTLLVIPDTQNYFDDSISYDIYINIFRWAIDNQRKYNIKAILQTGDITKQNKENQWELAKRGYELLKNDMPYILCVGNHDYEGSGNPKNRKTLINTYFNLDSNSFNNNAVIEYGFFEENKLENYYIILDTHPTKTLVVSLEWYTRDTVINWGNSILSKYKEYKTVILTHAYLDLDNSRYNYIINDKNSTESKLYGPEENNNNNAQQLWDKLIKKHPNIFLVLSGHILGSTFRISSNDDDRNTNQMAFNSQHEPNGGNGWLRLLEFWSDSTTVEVHTVSPTLMKVRRDSKNYFLFTK